MQEWSELFSNRDYQRIRLDTFGNISISTVWLGVEHDCGMFYETMILGATDEPQWRWRTEAEAIAGHERIMSDIRNHVADFVNQLLEGN